MKKISLKKKKFKVFHCKYIKPKKPKKPNGLTRILVDSKSITFVNN